MSDASEDHCYIEFIMPQTFHAFCADQLRRLKLYNLVTVRLKTLLIKRLINYAILNT